MYKKYALLLVLLLVSYNEALASVGIFYPGMGYKLGTAGAGSASYATDGTDAGSNPALLTDQHDNIIISLGIFHPDRKMDTSAAPAGNPQTRGWTGSRLKNFPDGSIGYRAGLGRYGALGISVSGSGLGTKYSLSSVNPGATIPSNVNTGVMYRVGFLTPALAYKVSNDISLGVALIVSYANVKSDAVVPTPPFTGPFSETVGRNKHDGSWGLGARVGGKLRATEYLDLGFTIATPVWTERFDRYRDLFIGPINYPANGTVGLSYKILPCTHLLADYKLVYYKGTKAISATPQKGGFGWKNQSSFMIGVEHHLTKHWSGRAGYSYSTAQIGRDKTFANIIAPAIVQQHIAAGATYKPVKAHEFTLTSFYVPRKTRTESGTGDALSRLGVGAKVSMWQWGIQGGWKFNF